MRQLESLRLATQSELFEMRPGPLGINEIRRQRGNSAPVVDAGVEELLVVRIRKIWRRLNVDFLHQQPSYRERAQHLAAGRIRPGAHGNFYLHAKGLEYDLINMCIP